MATTEERLTALEENVKTLEKRIGVLEDQVGTNTTNIDFITDILYSIHGAPQLELDASDNTLTIPQLYFGVTYLFFNYQGVLYRMGAGYGADPPTLTGTDGKYMYTIEFDEDFEYDKRIPVTITKTAMPIMQSINEMLTADYQDGTLNITKGVT